MKVSVQVPFEGDQDLVLDPYVKGDTYEDAVEHLLWFLDTMSPSTRPDDNYNPEEALERVFRAAVVLKAAGAGTFPECLRTAIVWERG